MTALLELKGIGKTFPGVVALDGVGLAVAGGEIRALMGENGAGKSTLLKILGGDYRPDAGQVFVDGAATDFASPRASADAGVAIIHQELQLAPDMTVAENLCLGAMPQRFGVIDRRAMRERAGSMLARLGEDIDPDARLGSLSIGKRQMVEIGKALLRDARIIAFDEPTSSLSARETTRLLGIIRELKKEGRAILYVSHRMEEVFALCDSLTVLRDGRLAGDHASLAAVGEDQLIREMAGREIRDVYGYTARDLGEVSVAVEGLAGPGLTSPVSFSAQRGEILGFFGLVGAGRSELFKLLYGATARTGGAVRIHGAARALPSPRQAIASGMALLPEDRKDEAIVPLMSVRENIVLAWRNLAGRGGLLKKGAETETAKSHIGALRIRTASAETPIASLSGGNQQKAILARWLAADADILLMDEPTRGIDIGARSEIYALMHRLAGEGKTLLVISSDLPEVMGVADRIVVMREGAVSAVVARGEATPENLLRHALPDAGGKLAASA
jgi:L-arabinose transport system ATP-binding protein